MAGQRGFEDRCAGGHVQFAASGRVAAQASGKLVNTATVEAIGVLDPNMSNNSATDGDTVLCFAPITGG